MSTYLVIIGDLIDSKKIQQRKMFQKKLLEIFADLNQAYRSTIISNFTVTTGDEFQAILCVNNKVLILLDELYVRIPHKFRLGIGLGEISTEINPELSIGADGEAFWHARAALNYVHGNNYHGKCHIAYKSGERKFDSLVNTLFLLTETLKSAWTGLQQETFGQLLAAGIYDEQFKQKSFAESLGISASSLSKRLTSGNIKAYLRGRKEIQRLWEETYEQFS